VSPQKLGDHRARAAAVARSAGVPYVLVIEHPDGSIDHHAFASREELTAEYAKIAEHHDQYAYVGAFDVQASPAAPVVDSVGVPAAEHAEVPAPVEPGAPPSEEHAAVESPKKGLSTGMIVGLAALGVVGIAGIVYATRKPARKSSPIARRRTPKVIVATATPALPGMPARTRALGA
jgi:hypothetical protein